MASDLSLLFQLRADNAQAKAVMADTRAAVTQLRSQFGKEITSMQSVAKTALADIGENVNAFVGQRIPLIGGAFLRVTSNLKGFNDELKKGGPQTKALAEQIDGIAKSSGKSSAEVSKFLTTFVRLEGQTARNNAAFKFFGGSVDLIGNKTAKFLPQLEEAGSSLAAVSTEAAGAGASLAAAAGPIGIAVIVIGALAIGAASAAKELFQLTKQAAEFQGRMFDLAQQTGLQVETLSALEVVAKTTGGELGSITQAIVNFQRKLDDAQDPLSKTAEQFRKFQISTTDTETALRQTFAALAAMPPGFAQTNAAAEFFGARGGKQVLAILKETNGDLDATIKKLREMGILITDDAARAADKFNDELELLNFQIRALGAAAARDLIPAMTEVIKSMGDLVRASGPVIEDLSAIGGPVTRSAATALRGLSTVIRVVTGDYKGLAEAIRKAREEKEIAPLEVPDVEPVPLPSAPTPQQTTSEAVNQAEAVLAETRRRVASHNQELNVLFQQGRRNREQQAEETIQDNKKVLKAEQDRIDAILAKKVQEQRALEQAQRDRGEVVNRDTEAFRAITAEIVKLQQERLDKENEFEVSSKAIRAKAAKERADSTRNQIQNDTDLLANEFDRQVKNTEAAIKRGETVEKTGLTIIEALERAKIDARIEGLEQQKRVGFLTIQEQIDLDNELKKLAQERDRLSDEQAQRRLDRERATGQRAIEIAIVNIDTLLRLEQIAGQRRIDSILALASLRVIAEEAAAKKILQIRLDLIDDEIEATQERLKASSAIADKDERIRTQAELNNAIKVLTEERKSIQAAGNRDIDEGRKRDLENERRYADELRSIRERINDIQREAGRAVIDLMILNHARRRDIIRAQAQLDLQEENDRHQRELDSLRQQEAENAESKKTKEEKLETEKELNLQREAETERHQLELEKIEKRRKEEEKESTPLGRLGFEVEGLKDLGTQLLDALLAPLETLKDAFRELQDQAREFVATIQGSVVPLGEILRGAFLQVADAIGQTVANYVLLGETGPAVMRKILAQALASIAAEAAVNAIKELALGFATLFFNPAESAAHFTAAAIWGSIGGVAAIAGRGVAGDLFKQKSTGAGGGAGTGSSSPDALQTIVTGRNQPQPINVIVQLQGDDSKLANFITASVVSNIGEGGEIREVLANDRR